MRVWENRRYGGPDVLKLAERPRPVPKPDEVLIRMAATTVSSGDARLRASDFPGGFWFPARMYFGLFRPRKTVLGCQLSGIVAEVGSNVTRFAPGDEVTAFPDIALGCHAEFAAVPQRVVEMKPFGLDFSEAAALGFGGTTALWFLREKEQLKPGARLLVIGASGAVGSAAVQIGRHLGARVTGVCSGPNMNLVHSLGAAEVTDYTRADPCAGGPYDVIFDTVGSTDFARVQADLAPAGCYLIAVGTLMQTLRAGCQKGGQRVVAGSPPDAPALFADVVAMASAGVFRPLIDSQVPFSDLPKAHERADSGRKRGSVVVTLT